MTAKDPTRSLAERTPEELAEYIDDHIVNALTAADMIHPSDRDSAEYFVRNRLVAISDSWEDGVSLSAEDRRRRLARLRAVIFPEGS